MIVDEKVLDILKYFEIDEKTGFLLPNPLIKLPEEYEQWHQVADEIQELIEKNLLDDRLRQLPLISTEMLNTNNELRLAHLLLVTLAAGYVWQDGPDKARLSIPANISLPLFDVCNRLGLKPIVCHASVCLANWKPIGQMTIFDASMIDIITFRFIQHPANRWFFTLTAQIETELAEAICAIASACLHCKVDESTMQHIDNAVTKATQTIQRMKEYVPPDIFYNGFRHFLSGYTENALAEQGGIIFEGREDLGPQLLSGGSAAQSSTFHVLDEFLKIKHADDIEVFLSHQREYMPPRHRDFIIWVRENVAKIPNVQNVSGYREALLAVKKFRKAHINVVTKFIILPAKGNSKIGTGGSSFMHLLINIANDCNL
ncbi:Indoleamine 2,3-dioxygenase 1 [Dirofilaria immitis]|nr:Indoleamine 2,3-dioxygenase 1 [Dirofilaria immitis]